MNLTPAQQATICDAITSARLRLDHLESFIRGDDLLRSRDEVEWERGIMLEIGALIALEIDGIGAD